MCFYTKQSSPWRHGHVEIRCIAASAVTVDDKQNILTYPCMTPEAQHLMILRQEHTILSAKQLQNCVTLSVTWWYWVHHHSNLYLI